MVIMSVDYGDARTGIAISDPSETIATPIATLTEGYTPNLIYDIWQLVKRHDVEMIVVGYPINMDGSKGLRAEKSANLAYMLEQELYLPTELWDERLSTVQAHQALNAMNVRGKKRKEKVDTVAATIILEEYLAYRKNTKDKPSDEERSDVQ